MGTVRILIVLPLVRLAGYRPPLTAATAERNGIFLCDSLLREVLTPVIHKAGIQYGHVNTRTVIFYCATVCTEICYINGIQIPCAKPVGKVRCSDCVDGRTFPYCIGVCSGNIRKVLYARQFICVYLHGEAVNVFKNRENLTMLVKISQDRIGHRGIE